MPSSTKCCPATVRLEADGMNADDISGVGGNEETAQQYLTFMLDGEEYGIDILRVKEIRGWAAPRRMPNAPSWLKGIIDLRGSIVPIIDLRERFGIAPLDYGPATVVIVVHFSGDDSRSQRDMGIVVDAVSEVYSVAADSIKAAPSVSSAMDEQLIDGIAMVNNKMIALLDMDRLRRGMFARQSREPETRQVAGR